MLLPLLPQGLGGTKIRKKTVYAYAFNIDTYAPTYSEVPFTIPPSVVDAVGVGMTDLLQAPNYNGWVYGGVTQGQLGPLAAGGGSFLFDGSSGYVAIPQAGSPSITGTWTLETWVNVYDTNTRGMFGSRGPSDYSFDMLLESGNTVHADFGNGSNWIDLTASASYNYAINTWYYIGIVFTPSEYSIWVNASEVGSGTYSGTPLLTDNNHMLTIASVGLNAGAGYEFFYGRMAETALYTYGLSGTQFSSHFSAASSTNASTYPNTILGDTPDGYWRMNDSQTLLVKNYAA